MKIEKPQDGGLVKRQDQDPVARGVGQPGSWSSPKLGRWMNHNDIITQLSQCDEQITPDCLRALYQIPVNLKANSQNSYGIVEYSPQAYLPSDLDLFFANFSTRQVGDRPTFDSVDGGVLQTTDESFDYNGKLTIFCNDDDY